MFFVGFVLLGIGGCVMVGGRGILKDGVEEGMEGGEGWSSDVDVGFDGWLDGDVVGWVEEVVDVG